MNILSSCISVVALITWTSYHPAVETNMRQRVQRTITSILFPQVLFMLAVKDFVRAALLRSELRKLPGWGEHWTLKDSFLVVKGGIVARPAETPISQPVEGATYICTIEHELLSRLASVGCVRLEDFPSASVIDDKSKANWFAKTITLLQLTWFTTNFYYRVLHGYKVCPLEAATMEWIVWGTPALLIWWQCPQNITVFEYVPVIKFSDPEREPPLTSQPESAQLDTLLRNTSLFHDAEPTLVCILALFFCVLGATLFFVSAFLTGFTSGLSTGQGKCPLFNARYATIPFMLLTAFAMLVYLFTELFWFHSYYCVEFVQFLVSDYPTLRQPEAERRNMWLNAAAEIGLHDCMDSKQWRFIPDFELYSYAWGVVLVAVCVLMLFRLGAVIVAFASFRSTPIDVYDVPKAWVLEAIVHVGG